MEGRGMKSVKNFPRPEPRKIKNFLIIACTLLSLCILSLVKARYCPSPYVKSATVALKLQVSTEAEVKVMKGENGDDYLPEDEDEEGKGIDWNKPLCYESSKRSDTCEAQGEIRVLGSSQTMYVDPFQMHQDWRIKPYARKGDNAALSHVKQWTIKPFPPNQPTPECTSNHTLPAIIFSLGGFTGNLFHDFTDVLVPLFITSHQFHGKVHLLASDSKSWWLAKFKMIFKQFSDHEVIDLDADGPAVRCFPRVIVGPSFHKELGIDSSRSPTGYSMEDFKIQLRKALGLERSAAMSSLVEGAGLRRPRLLIISRKKSRRFVNERGMVSMATSLGFDVRIGKPDINTDVAKFARLVNSADVMIGVHGAGLTNMVFLPQGAVLIQVIPLGGLEWLARDNFRAPAEDMGVRYLEYKIREDESTLIEQYPKDHPVLKDPFSYHKKGWDALKEVYLDKQNVRPHLGRLRDTLREALKLLPQSS